MRHDMSPEIVFHDLVQEKIITPEQLPAVRTGFDAFNKADSELLTPASASGTAIILLHS